MNSLAISLLLIGIFAFLSSSDAATVLKSIGYKISSDDSAPYHCSKNGVCGMNEDVPISAGSNFVLTSNMTIYWSGWRSSTPIVEYKVLLLRMKAELRSGVFNWIEDNNTTLTWTLPGSSSNTTIFASNLTTDVYSLILAVTNEAGSSACARQLILVDLHKSLITMNETEFMIVSANRDSNYQWIGIPKTGVASFTLSWKGVFTFNPLLLQEASLTANYGPSNCVFETSLIEEIVTVGNSLGTKEIEFADEVVDDDGRDFEERLRNNQLVWWTPPPIPAFPDDEFHRTSKRAVRDGQTYIASLRTVDMYGRRLVYLTRAHAVSSAPNVSAISTEEVSTGSSNDSIPCRKRYSSSTGIQWDLIVASFPFLSFPFLRVKLVVVDAVAGVKTIQWQLYTKTVSDQILLEEGFIRDISVNRSDCLEQSQQCYCAMTSSGIVRSIGCFRSTFELVLNTSAACASLKGSEAISADFLVVSYAEMERRVTVELWNSVASTSTPRYVAGSTSLSTAAEMVDEFSSSNSIDSYRYHVMVLHSFSLFMILDR